MTLVGEAFAIAAEVHKNQVDKAGEPYILHCVAVMQRATKYHLANSDGWKLEQVQAAAILHDSIEDYEGDGIGYGRLINHIYDLDKDVAYAVEALTKQRGEHYEDYLEAVARNWIARTVKIADLSHNLDVYRIPKNKITEKDYERWDKYHRAIVKLKRED